MRGKREGKEMGEIEREEGSWRQQTEQGQTDRRDNQIDRQKGQSDRQTDRRDSQTDRQKGQSDRQTDRQTDRRDSQTDRSIL